MSNRPENYADRDAKRHPAVVCDCASECPICPTCGWPVSHEIHAEAAS